MQEKEYGCVFSIVIAVYNCEPFLRETLDSILNQDISELFKYKNGKRTAERLTFEEICEVIMVDDGSTDLSGSICDEYSEKYSNFKVIHKKNGGVASARNEGMRHVTGKYMNFLDSDDKFSENVFSEIYGFFEENYEKTDVATMPLIFFDAAEGEHWQNYKFKEYPCVTNLYNNYNCPLMFVNASFFKSEYKENIKFCGALVCGEDIRFICEVIADKMTMGLVPNCHYYYRRRSIGEESLIQSTKKKTGWYFAYFEHLTEWGVNFCKQKWGYVPYYYQNILVCDLQWRFNNDYEETAISLLGEAEYERYKKRLFDVMKLFDDKIILIQRNVWKEHKCMMLEKKHGTLPERCVYPDDVRLRFGNTLFCWLSNCFTDYEFISIKDGILSLEGTTMVIGYPEATKYEVMLESREAGGATRLFATEKCERDKSKFKLGERLYTGIGFKFSIPLKEIDSCELWLVLFADGERIVKKKLRFGKFSPIGLEFESSYYFSEGYMITPHADHISVKRASRADIRKQRRAFLSELRRSEKEGAKKAALALKVTSFLKKFKRKPLVIISDRINKAGDNGEAFFRYLCDRNIKNFTFLFAIEKDAADSKRLKRLFGRTIDRSSRKYKILHLLADIIVSSHADELTTNPFSGNFAPYREILSRQKYVFLQHGITKDNASVWLNRYNRNASGIVCAAKKEADAFEEKEYCYSAESIWRTGFPRFDRLYDAERRIITIMPTWRMYLSLWDRSHEGVWKSSQKFSSSDYFKFYNRLLNDEELISEAKKHGYTLAFMPHPNVFGSMDEFTHHPDVIFFKPDKEYCDIFAESSIVLTDYSSAVFDFAYLRKPIIYTQFDKDEFFSGSHAYTKGYFDYERDGFGEVAYDYQTTVGLLKEYMSSGCKMKEKYKRRADIFFLFSDRKNCERVYKKISKLLENP